MISYFRSANHDGRASDFFDETEFEAGIYKMHFDTASYFKSINVQDYFFPYAEVSSRLSRQTKILGRSVHIAFTRP